MLQAETLLASLRDLAAEGGYTVVVSIQQQRSSILAMFHDLLLPADGEGRLQSGDRSEGTRGVGLSLLASEERFAEALPL